MRGLTNNVKLYTQEKKKEFIHFPRILSFILHKFAVIYRSLEENEERKTKKMHLLHSYLRQGLRNVVI